MRYIHRNISEKLKSFLSSFPCLVVSGARQVGKSTLLQHLFPSFNYVVFDPVLDIENARKDPDLFLKNRKPPLILDEIQYAPEVVAALKRKIDREKQAGAYVLTGSQQWGVLKNLSESLAGRAVFLHLDGFSLAEIAEVRTEKRWIERWLENPEHMISSPPTRLQLPHTLYEQLYRGTLPYTHFLDISMIPTFHAGYQTTYIERDVRLLADIPDLHAFNRFVRLVAAHSGQEVHYSQFGRDIGISPQTAKRWLDLLKATYQWIEHPAYFGNTIKRLSQKPKGYLTDTGQICASLSISSPNAIAGHPLYGAIFESAVISEIRKQLNLMSLPAQTYHWRTYSGAECDLILERDGKLYPIEIKGKSHPNHYDSVGIKRFIESHPQLKVEKGLIIAPSETFYPVTEDVYVIPWDSL